MPDLTDIDGLAELRARTLGREDVAIAVLDGRANADHPSLQGADVEYVDGDWIAGIEGESWARDHATGIASVLFGQPGTSVEGIAPRCRGHLIASAVDETTATTEMPLTRAIEAAIARAVPIIHCSFCVPSVTSTIGDLLAAALRKAVDAGILIVAPSGNNADVCRCTPADQPGVVAVGALNDDGSIRDSSSYGDRYVGHGVMAFGENVLVATVDGGTARQTGTSVATPQVTGIAALILSIARDRGLDPDPRDVGRAIVATARPLDPGAANAEAAIGGVIDPVAALDAVLGDQGATASRAKQSLRLPSRLFAIGQLDIDIADEQAELRLAQRMGGAARRIADTADTAAVAVHLEHHPEDATLVTFVLARDGQPRLTLGAAGPHADRVNERLIAVLRAGTSPAPGEPPIDQISVAGVLTARTIRLRSGIDVPFAMVNLPQNLHAWDTRALAVSAAHAAVPQPESEFVDSVADFLRHVYQQHRNDGLLGRDRALNHAATNAKHAAQALAHARARSLNLARIDVVKSRFDRPNSECWDVLAYFDDPSAPDRAERVYTWTVDVAEPRPVSIGAVRSWPIQHSSWTERPQPPVTVE